MILSILVIALLVVGVFFLTVAAIGFVRLPDVFCRLHISGVIDTLGAPLLLLAAALYLGVSLASGKLLLAILFLYVTSPLVGHLLARAAVVAGYQPKTFKDQTDAARARHYERELEDDSRLQATATAPPSGGDA
ncbi:MAG: monovalent cation/H(+) antiporter subunit G [Phycisphaeraceae bacterium]